MLEGLWGLGLLAVSGSADFNCFELHYGSGSSGTHLTNPPRTGQDGHVTDISGPSKVARAAKVLSL